MYRIKLTLITPEKIIDKTLMQYINFGMKSSLYAIEGSDTLPCVICERIPGIRGNEYLYMACFNKPEKSNNNNLRLIITDSKLGFGTMAFEIKKHS